MKLCSVHPEHWICLRCSEQWDSVFRAQRSELSAGNAEASSSQDFELSACWESSTPGLLELRVINPKEAASYPFQDFCPSRAKEHSQLLSHLLKCTTEKRTSPRVTASGGDHLDRTSYGLSTGQESKSQTKKPLFCSDSQLLCFSLFFPHINGTIQRCVHPLYFAISYLTLCLEINKMLLFAFDGKYVAFF